MGHFLKECSGQIDCSELYGKPATQGSGRTQELREESPAVGARWRHLGRPNCLAGRCSSLQIRYLAHRLDSSSGFADGLFQWRRRPVKELAGPRVIRPDFHTQKTDHAFGLAVKERQKTQ